MFPQIFGKYVLEREMGAGGMARVYLATLRGAVGFEKRLVVKQIRSELASDPAFVRRFVEEAKTAVELNHPNIVPVYELGVEQGVYYIAMELCEGLTLAEVLGETSVLLPEEGAYLGVEICRALDYAHRRVGIVHRDVTPRNVLLDEEGEVRLIDFGIAAPSHGSSAERVEVFGSPGHMPPEQLRGAELTPATDVFAVGVLLIEAWTGRPPFRRATAKESEAALLANPPRIDVNNARLTPLADLIASSIARDPKLRPARAEQLARPLRDFLKAVDRADIAQRLGARVRLARQRLRSSSPWVDTGTSPSLGVAAEAELASPPRAALAPAQVTQTFAARNDIEVWTRKLLSEPPRDSDDAPRGATPAAAGARSRLKVWPILGVALAVSLLGLVLTRARPPVAAAPRVAASNALGTAFSASVGPPAILAASAPAAALVEAAPPPLAPVLPEAVAERRSRPNDVPARRAAASASAASASSAAADASGTLKITADPRATVRIEGAHFSATRETPVLALQVPIGSYALTFRNETYGSSLSARVSVVEGTHRDVHADFRETEPRISIR